MDNKALLALILKVVEEHKLTPYEISKKTKHISSQGIKKILTEETKKPTRNSLLVIVDAIEKMIVGVDLPIEVLREARSGTKAVITADKGVPYYNIEINGSIISSFDDIQENIEFFVDYEPMNDCTAFLPYSGESMLPVFKPGDTLGVKQIKNLDVLLWGEPHLVITNENANNYKTVKNIYPHPDSEKIILRAKNPEHAGDTPVNKQDIVFMGIVKGKVELTQM